MKIGMIGLGKLGLPCAVGMALRGHDVMGFDMNPALMDKAPRPYRECGPDGKSDFNPYLEASSIRFGSLQSVIEHAEILFLAVQTPHEPAFEGSTRLPDERRDFDYRYLESAIASIAELVQDTEKHIVIISTVLPGTVRERIMPLTSVGMKLAYNPYFIAMGTTMCDFFHPEFSLCGCDSLETAEVLQQFYSTIHDAPVLKTTIENAELIKVAYNTYIGMKIGFANTLMEICHKTPNTNVDEVTDALCMATNRLISGKYMRGGMGDGGGCHPRDNIALSWLSEKLGLSFNWFEFLMTARELQTGWLADLMEEHALPKAILGYSFKPESNITVGSPAVLLSNLLIERGHTVFMYDPLVDGEGLDVSTLRPMVFLIGTRHQVFETYRFPIGSIVIDPWRFIPQQAEGVQVISIGNTMGLTQNCEAVMEENPLFI